VLEPIKLKEAGVVLHPFTDDTAEPSDEGGMQEELVFELLHEGFQLLKRGNAEEGVRILRQFLQFYPDDYHINNMVRRAEKCSERWTLLSRIYGMHMEYVNDPANEVTQSRSSSAAGSEGYDDM
jgi:hypothetical protein